ncbi:hypothetical protein D3C72_2509830 [compost metagenome]
MVTYDANLFFDQIVVIEQPFAGGGHAGFLAVAQLVAAFRQYAFVFVQPFQQKIGGLARRQLV